MVVTHNHINSPLLCILHLLHSLDAAVKCNKKGISTFMSPVNSLVGNAVPLIIPHRYVVLQILGKGTQECIYKRNCRCAVHIVVSVNQNFLVVLNSFVHTLYRLLHILHQERVMQHLEVWPEECPRLLVCCNAPLHQKVRQHRICSQFLSQTAHSSRVSRLLHYPLSAYIINFHNTPIQDVTNFSGVPPRNTAPLQIPRRSANQVRPA